MKRSHVVALAGGVGAARFLDGLTRVIEPERVYIIGNTADDAEIHGLHISPDLDTVMYTLAGLANPLHGWGIRGDSTEAKATVARLAETILGVRAIDAGPLENARLLESAAVLLISLNLRHKVKGSGMRITGLSPGGASA